MPDEKVAFDPMALPDDAEMQRQEKALEDVWSGSLAKMKEAHEFYSQGYNIWEDFKKSNPDEASSRPNYTSPVAPALINMAADAALALVPKLHVREAGPGEGHKKKSSAVENALQEIVHDAFQWSTDFPPRASAVQLLLYNYTILGVSLRFNAVEKRPEQKDGETKEDFQWREFLWESERGNGNPFLFEVPQPGEVLMNPNETSPQVAIRRRRIRAYDLRDKVLWEQEHGNNEAKFTEKLGSDPYEEVEVTEWISARWYRLKLKGGETLYTKKGWGVQPWAHTFGIASVAPIGEDADPKHRVSRGLLFDQMPTIIMHDQAIIAYHQIIQRAAWARMGTRLTPADAAQRATGAFMQGDEDDFWLEKVPPLAPESYRHLEMLRQIIRETTYSLEAAGYRTSGMGADTATGAIILSEKTSRKFKLYQERLGHIYGIGCSIALHLAKRLQAEFGIGEIGVGEYTLKVLDIESYQVQAKFENIDQVAFMQEKEAIKQDLKDGLASEERFAAVSRIEDWSHERGEIIKDRLRRTSPDIIAMEEATALQEMGLEAVANRKEREIELRHRARQLVGPDGVTPLASQPEPVVPGQNGGVPNA